MPASLPRPETDRVEDTRYQRLEERLAWLERHVLEQDKSMLELGRAQDALKKQLSELRSRQASPGAASEGEIFDGNERPPHY